MDSLKQQVAIITGGGTGIGREITLALAGEGVKVAVCGRRLDPLVETVNAVKGLQGEALAIQADVAAIDDVQKVVNSTVESFGAVDILVNNAGIYQTGPIHEHDIEVWDRVMAINLRGPFLFARTVLPLMRARRSGQIINISSNSGIKYFEGSGAYGVSKHALNALAEFIQQENQAFGIRVSSICPGMVLTPMAEGQAGLIPENCLRPEDIADMVLWLLTRQPNIKMNRPILVEPMNHPWE